MSINGLSDYFSLCSGGRQKEEAKSKPDPISQVFSSNPLFYSPLPKSDSPFKEEDASETSPAKSPSIISGEELEAEMPDEFDFEDDYEEISGSEVSTDPETRLIDMAEETLEDLFARAHDLKKLKSPDAPRMKKRAKRLEKELNKNEKPKAPLFPFKKERLDLDSIPNRDVSVIDRKMFINKLLQNITNNYLKEDRAQVFTIFISKLELTVDEVATLLINLQHVEQEHGFDSDAPNYMVVADRYLEIPKYQDAGKDLQKKMDQFLIDADRRMAITKEEAIRNQKFLDVKKLN